jgi:hypothetical protein
MCKTGKAILLGAKTKDVIRIKCRLDVITCCVIVAGIICCYAEELLTYISTVSVPVNMLKYKANLPSDCQS